VAVVLVSTVSAQTLPAQAPTVEQNVAQQQPAVEQSIAQQQPSQKPPPAAPVEPMPNEGSVLKQIFPEPQQSLLNPSPPLPAGGLPLLRRITGVAETMDKLPPFLRDTSLNVHFRTFYFDRLNSDGSTNEAWAAGGWLAYKSGWLADTFAIGAVGYTS